MRQGYKIRPNLLVLALSFLTLICVSSVSNAATQANSVASQEQSSTNGVAVSSQALQTLSADQAESASDIRTNSPMLNLVHCCHAHPYPPYDTYCCHPPSTTIYVAPRPVYGVGAASVRGTSRRTARRVSRRR